MKRGNKGLLKLFLVLVLTFIFCGTLSAEDVAAADQWVQTTGSDFQQGQIQNIDISTSPGDVVLTQGYTTNPVDASASVPLTDFVGNPISTVSNPDLAIDGSNSTAWQGVTGYVSPVDASASVPLTDFVGNPISTVSNPDLAIDGSNSTAWQGLTGYITPKSASADINNADSSATIDGNNATYWQGTSENASIIFDLGEIRKVNGFRQTSGTFPGNPYTAYVSSDGVIWAQVYSGTLTRNSLGVVPFYGVRDVRFIKLVVQRTDSNGYGELAEFNALVEDASVMFDLGEIRKVTGFRETTGNYLGNPYVAYVSSDGVIWAQVYSGTLTRNSLGVVPFYGVRDVRFIKLVVQRTDSNGYGELAEFNVMVEDATIVFDLGEVRKVTGFRATSGNYPSSPYVAYVSTDGLNWTQVGSGTIIQNGWTISSFSVRDVRYIKLVLQRTDNNGYGELAELNIMVDEYSPSGTLTSQVFDAGSTVDWGIITWSATLPAGTSLKIETRCSSDGNNWSPWQTTTNGNEVPSPNARYLQYRATLQTNDPNSTPSLQEIIINYQGNRPPVLNYIGSKTVDENQNLQFTISGSDPDGNSLSYSVSGLPTGATFDSATKTFIWTPNHSQAGNYPVTFTVADGVSTDSETVTITVVNKNRAPVMYYIGPQSVNEGESLSLTLSGNDPDGGSLTYSASELPTGAIFIGNVFSWTPNFAQAGSYQVTYTVTDEGGLTNSETVTFTVNNMNRPPILNSIGNQQVYEGQPLSFTVSGVDADSDGLIYSASGLPSGASFDPATRTFSWTPNFSRAGLYDVTFTVSDGSLSASEIVTISVSNVNQAPVVGTIDGLTVSEQQAINFQVPGFDADGDALTYSPVGTWPDGAQISSSGLFTWAPSYTQAGDYTLDFIVGDGTTSTPGSIHITVNNVNRAPLMGAIGAQSVDENQNLAFTVSGSDADEDVLTHSASPLPAGATFNPQTGAFQWTPSYEQAGTYQVTFIVTDAGGATDTETVIFTVNNINRPPVLNLIGNQAVNEGGSKSFAVSGSDSDGDPLIYSAFGLPAGATFDGTTFSWTPTYDQAGSYSVTFQVSDGTSTDSETVPITVTNVNRAPLMGAIGAQSVDENQNLAFTVSGSDADGDQVTYSATGLPSNAAFNPASGSFSWIPTYEQAGIYEVTFTVTDEGGATDTETVIFTVNNVNRPPVVGTIDGITVSEQQAINFQVPGFDADGDALTYSPLGTWPDGAQISSSGLITWIPSYVQSGGYTLDFLVNDGIITTTGSIPITITNVNQAPIFEPIGAQSVDENHNLAFTLAGSDADGDMLTYSATGLPSGSTLIPATGAFTWTPTYAQAGAYPVTFTVSDGSLTASVTVTITVNNVDRPPVLNTFNNLEVNEGANLSFTVSATDPDDDPITYSAMGLPEGAIFEGGTFNWDSAVSGVYTITFTATAGGLSDSRTITITVLPNANQAPVAILDGPYTAYEGSEITFDGSASYDPDGHILNYEWDLNGDGVFETPGTMVSKTWLDDYTGTVSLRVTDSNGLSSVASSTVTVTNTAPSATLSSSFMVKVPITMRVAGQPGNSVELQIIQDGVVVASKTIVFAAGSPNEQQAYLLANIDMSKTYTARLVFNTNSQASGATPVWLIIDGKKTKVATFKSNPNNPSTWSQTLNIPLKGLFTLANKEITFNAQASDSGTDTITFEWSFGDGTGPVVNTSTLDGTTVINDSVTHTYLLPGVYQLILTVRDDEGAEVSYQMEVRVV